MKTLFLVRHAKAASQESKVADIDRPLTKEGKKDVQKMAKKLRKNAPVPQLIITSPAKRAVKSARLFTGEYSFSKDTIVLNDLLYEPPNDAAETALLAVVRNIDNQYQTVMIIGHDPLLSKFANFLQKSFKEKIPAGTVVEFEFLTETWKDIARNSGTIKFFDYPGRKKEQKKKNQTDLQSKIEAGIMRILGKIDQETAKKMDKTIRKTSQKFAKEFTKELTARERQKKMTETSSEEKSRDNSEKKKPKETIKKRPAEGRVKRISKTESASEKKPGRKQK